MCCHSIQYPLQGASGINQYNSLTLHVRTPWRGTVGAYRFSWAKGNTMQSQISLCFESHPYNQHLMLDILGCLWWRPMTTFFKWKFHRRLIWVSLCNCVFIFFIGCQPNDFVSYLPVARFTYGIWCLNEAIFVQMSIWMLIKPMFGPSGVSSMA